MRKTVILLFVLLAFCLASVSFGQTGQTRPRRAGNASSGESTSSQPPVSPSRPPVLGGTKSPNSQQPKTEQQPADNGPVEVDAGDIIRVDTTLVTLPVSVMDRDGRYVPNLRKEDFRLWEDGVEQQVAFFSSVDKPFSVVLMLDTSPSTQFRLEDISHSGHHLRCQ